MTLLPDIKQMLSGLPTDGTATPETPEDHKLNRRASIGYNEWRFAGKLSQKDLVVDIIQKQNWIPGDKIKEEVDLYYGLGIDDLYFSETSVDTIAGHVLSFYAAKCKAAAKQNDGGLQVSMVVEAEDHAVYIDTSFPGVTDSAGPLYEIRLEDKYLNFKPGNKNVFRVETFRSAMAGVGTKGQELRSYFVNQCHFVNDNLDCGDEANLEMVSDKTFLEKASKNTKSIYKNMIEAVLPRTGPVIDRYEVEGTGEWRIVIGLKRGSGANYFSAITDLYHYYGIQESVYAHCVSIFTTHFLNRLGNEYTTLRQQLDPNNALHQQLLAKLKRRLRSETYTRNDIVNSIRSKPEVIKVLYQQFADVHRIVPKLNGQGISRPTSTSPASISGQGRQIKSQELLSFVATQTTDEHQTKILSGFLIFNDHVLKTNFYQATKSAISFRFDPAFLPLEEYPQRLFAMFFVVGAEFRGFHLRFKNVSRGGIRLVSSRSNEAYSINARSLFDENYALASTQDRKNKELPEGGAKGVILLDADAQDKGESAFQKYVDSLIDLLLEGKSPNIKDKIVDLYGKDETLYCGPDEGTAGFVDWATTHAKTRGAPWWKSFFTGKSKTLGGIPHDVYGMTSLSVRQYLERTYERLGLDERTMTKVQTGGPDGDLGSNEILLGQEKTVAIIDGSGVLCDPAGLSKTELLRLARARQMISHYDTGVLSPQGYRILIDEVNRVLPTGEKVARGIDFRNSAHLRNFNAGQAGRSADVLSPQGGRPEAINISNVGGLIENGTPTYSYIIEGANLFITQDARLELEKAGCVVFKDASTNKVRSYTEL
ncbi:putative NAD dependent glutamate dehydrogenase [Taphrina deformans PYCC 5710]|uniref:NAD dependent glutamate dehydrogenase n=1 Tax=Taphrina deformans (strain PYCC 5710 / ATCC 11124 / CBS 356.35 / IMI 108563 / JCM 9778 / NBRC 8474) TaxID=1097556 RepID=R4XE80_TAPDE|nr:putative NAD dependent glutamate dehydrogenase [Taphrina deformans PYCC 5710]|eukprot:CCG82760.1 putative NAD dependent glutamate dehydrogenase [Taphrina deformans PYCC 5710]